MGSSRGWAVNRLLWAAIGSGALLGVAGVLSVAASTFTPSPSRPSLEFGTVIPTVKTAVRDASGQVVTSIPFGESFHDSAVVSGSSGTPTGTVTFRLFGTGICSGTAENVSNAFTLRSGSVDATTFAFNGAVNTFSFRATYSGNATYAKQQGPCEPITVVRAKPSVATHVRNDGEHDVTSVLIGAYAHDFVQVSASSTVPTGTVTLEFYRDGSCSTVAATSSAKSLVNGKVDVTSFRFTSNHPALLSFRATYNGDSAFTKRTGTCEPFSVKAQPSVATTPMDFTTGHAILTAPYGDFMVSRNRVTGSWGVPTGSVNVVLFANATCAAPAIGTATGTLTNGSVNLLAAPDPRLKPGTYAYRTTYLGDITYAARNSLCESFGVEPAPAVLTATIEDANGTTVASVPVGTVVHVHAVVTGHFATPTGNVTAVGLQPGCQGLGTAGSAFLSGGAADITARTATASQVGTNIAFAVGYGGDAIYGKASGVCVEVAVTAASSTPKPATPPPSTPQPVATPVATIPGDLLPSPSAAELQSASASEQPTAGTSATAGAAVSPSPVASSAPAGSTVSSGPDATLLAIAALVIAGLLVAAFVLLGRGRTTPA